MFREVLRLDPNSIRHAKTGAVIYPFPPLPQNWVVTFPQNLVWGSHPSPPQTLKIWWKSDDGVPRYGPMGGYFSEKPAQPRVTQPRTADETVYGRFPERNFPWTALSCHDTEWSIVAASATTTVQHVDHHGSRHRRPCTPSPWLRRSGKRLSGKVTFRETSVNRWNWVNVSLFSLKIGSVSIFLPCDIRWIKINEYKPHWSIYDIWFWLTVNIQTANFSSFQKCF